MKCIQRFFAVLAPLGFLLPNFVNGAEVNIKNHSSNSLTSATQVQVVNPIQFSDVFPGDWAYVALQNLSDSYDCQNNSYSETLNSGQSLTRYEVAELINACLEGEFVTSMNSDAMRLLNEFETEMTILKGRLDGLRFKFDKL